MTPKKKLRQKGAAPVLHHAGPSGELREQLEETPWQSSLKMIARRMAMEREKAARAYPGVDFDALTDSQRKRVRVTHRELVEKTGQSVGYINARLKVAELDPDDFPGVDFDALSLQALKRLRFPTKVRKTAPPVEVEYRPGGGYHIRIRKRIDRLRPTDARKLLDRLEPILGKLEKRAEKMAG